MVQGCTQRTWSYSERGTGSRWPANRARSTSLPHCDSAWREEKGYCATSYLPSSASVETLTPSVMANRTSSLITGYLAISAAPRSPDPALAA